jgi:hypothetical protein
MEEPAEPEQPETAFVVGGRDFHLVNRSSIERYDAASGQWIAVAPMVKARAYIGACVLASKST